MARKTGSAGAKKFRMSAGLNVCAVVTMICLLLSFLSANH